MVARAAAILFAWLDRPRRAVVAIACAVLLGLPALTGGLIADDWFHRAHLDERATVLPEGRGPLLEMFNFFPADREFLLALRDDGIFPWWLDPDIRGGFLRPLSAVTHWIDWRLLGDRPVLHHLHSLGWVAACIAAAAAFFRTWLGPGRAAAFATLLFAVDDAHAWPTAWVANRNALVAMTFGLLAAAAHIRGRESGSLRERAVALAAFLAALLAGESGVAAGALLVGVEFGRAEPLGVRVRRILPYVVVGAVWLTLWKLGGYGISGSGLYVDPFRSPARFLAQLPERFGALTGALWWNLGVDFWVFLPHRISLGLGLAFGLGSVAALWWMAKDRPADLRARQAVLMACLCLVPPTAAFPMERVLTFAGVGAAAWFSLLLLPAVEAGLPRWRDRAVLFWHLPMSAFVLFAKAIAVPAFMGQLGKVAEAVPSDPGIVDDQLIILSGLEITTAYIPIERELRGLPVPRDMLVLAPAAASLTFTREDERTLRLDAASPMFGHAIEQLCREAPLPAGTRVQTNVALVEVLTDDGHGRPTSLRASFPESLDSDQYRWLAPAPGTLVPFVPPPVGDSVKLETYLPLPG